jgi:hypothetical protein
MKPSFIFAVATLSTFETLRNLNGYAHFPGWNQPDARSDPRLLALIGLTLALVYAAFPNWE